MCLFDVALPSVSFIGRIHRGHFAVLCRISSVFISPILIYSTQVVNLNGKILNDETVMQLQKQVQLSHVLVYVII
jgi:hypothetical protein